MSAARTTPGSVPDGPPPGSHSPEPGSFRDPDSRVLVGDGVFRALSEKGLADWEALAGARFFSRGVADGRLVATSRIGSGIPVGARALLRHERIPFVSYPYEWTFGMLRDAALLQLDLTLAALDEGLTVKDATPYNVQWRGASPVFIDIGSFERRTSEEPWIGYRQFCMQFLNPLLLQACRDVPFQPWLRGRLDGITPAECSRILHLSDKLRRGVFTHVVLHARMERRYGGSGGELRDEIARVGFSSELVRANLRKVRRLVESLHWRPRTSEWLGYAQDNSYTDRDAALKRDFVARAAAAAKPRLVWDLGANEGVFSRVAADHAEYVVAMDVDHAAVEALYQTLATDGPANVLPLVVDLVDGSPALGWRGRERTTLQQRGTPDLTLALALVHHVCLTRSVPPSEVLDWLRSLDSRVVVEYVGLDDPMAQRLAAAKRGAVHPEYAPESFERLLGERFVVESRLELTSGNRVLFAAAPRA